MNRLLKRPLRAIWRWTAPVRRPVSARVEAFAVHWLSTRPSVCHASADSELLMNHMLRELIRLQKQVDQLQESVEALASSTSGRAVVATIGPHESAARSAAG